MNELQTARTPETVGAEIRNLTAAAKYMTLWYGVEIGRRLTEAKDIIPHGGWLEFLKNETEFSQPTASRFMRLFSEYGAEQGNLFGAETKYSTLNNLSVSNALQLLAVPEEERESFAAAVDAEHISGKELAEAIKAREAAEAALEKANEEAGKAIEQAEFYEQSCTEYSKDNVRLMDDLANAERRIKELESRPVEVAVQEPDQEEINKRVGEAVNKAAAQYAEAQKKIEAEAEEAKEKLEKALAEAKTKLTEAQEQLAEKKENAAAGGLMEEVEQLKKKLAMSDAGMTVFKLRFTAWQAAYTEMTEAMEQLTDEQRVRCAGAVKAQIGAWSA